MTSRRTTLHDCAVEAVGFQLACLSTLCSLLTLKAEEMESSESGTGPLEADEALLTQPRQEVPRRLHDALVYRVEQKRICRHWLNVAKRQQQQQMDALAALAAKS